MTTMSSLTSNHTNNEDLTNVVNPVSTTKKTTKKSKTTPTHSTIVENDSKSKPSDPNKIKQKKEKKIKKKENEKDYSIATLLRKKQEEESNHNSSNSHQSHSKSSHYTNNNSTDNDDQENDSDDDDETSNAAAIDAVLIQTENMRRDTIATVTSSILHSPPKVRRPLFKDDNMNNNKEEDEQEEEEETVNNGVIIDTTRTTKSRKESKKSKSHKPSPKTEPHDTVEVIEPNIDLEDDEDDQLEDIEDDVDDDLDFVVAQPTTMIPIRNSTKTKEEKKKKKIEKKDSHSSSTSSRTSRVVSRRPKTIRTSRTSNTTTTTTATSPPKTTKSRSKPTLALSYATDSKTTPMSSSNSPVKRDDNDDDDVDANGTSNDQNDHFMVSPTNNTDPDQYGIDIHRSSNNNHESNRDDTNPNDDDLNDDGNIPTVSSFASALDEKDDLLVNEMDYTVTKMEHTLPMVEDGMTIDRNRHHHIENEDTVCPSLNTEGANTPPSKTTAMIHRDKNDENHDIIKEKDHDNDDTDFDHPMENDDVMILLVDEDHDRNDNATDNDHYDDDKNTGRDENNIDRDHNDRDDSDKNDDNDEEEPQKSATTSSTTPGGGWWSNVVSRVMTKSPTKRSNSNSNKTPPVKDDSSLLPDTNEAPTQQPEELQSLSPSPTSPSPKRYSTSAFQLFSGVIGRSAKPQSGQHPVNTSSDNSISNFDHESDDDDNDDDDEKQTSQEPNIYDETENENDNTNSKNNDNDDDKNEPNHDRRISDDHPNENVSGDDEDEYDEKIIDELSSYHDEEEDAFDEENVYGSGPHWIHDNYNDDDANRNNLQYVVDEHGNYYNGNDEEYYDNDNYNDGLYNDQYNNNNYDYNENDNDTLTEHDLEYVHDPNVQYGEDDGMLYNSTTHMEKSYRERRQRKRKRQWMIFGLVLCCCCIVAAAVLVVLFVVILPSKENDNNDAPPSIDDNICTPFQSSIGTAELCTILTNAIVPVHPNQTLPNLYNSVPTSCQFLTLDWMIGTISGDLQVVRSVTRIRQRYSFGVFHCEVYTPSWFTLDLHLTGDNNECTWSTSDLTDEITDITTPSCNGNNELLIVRVINGNEDDTNSTKAKKLKFQGTLPPELSMISSLQEITLSDHSIDLFGTIPSEYSLLTKLETFQLSSNALNGTIPNFIYNIRYVDLSNNTLTGSLPTRPSTTTTTTQQLLRAPSKTSVSLSPDIDADNADNDDYYFSGRRKLQDQLTTSTGVPKSLLLDTNQLSGSLSLVDIVRPGMEVFTVHTNMLSGEVTPPSLDQSKNLKRLTMYENNITGNVNVLCPLSDSEGGILETFVVDIDEVVCSCCTEKDDIIVNEDGFGNISPTIAVPKIPPPTMAPKITNAPVTASPTLLNITTSSPTMLKVPTFMPTNGTNTLSSSSSPSTMPTALSGIVIQDPVPTSNTSTSTTTNIPTIVSISIPTEIDASNDTTVLIDSNFTTRRPFQYFTTTKMEPYYSKQQPFDCNFTGHIQPHVLTQCRCYQTIQVLTDDIVGLYAQVREAIQNEIYTVNNVNTNLLINETIDSCSAQNQALIWLSSGNVRDSGDLYQRYVMALLYIQMNGTAWYNSSNWLTYHNECDWYGIDCRSSTANDDNRQIRSIQLDNNNILKTMPDEIRYLSTLQTLSLRNNRLSGTIPPSITLQYLPYLQNLLLSNNSLTGTIPSLFGSSTAAATSYLETVEVDTNFMYGTIPEWLFTSNMSTILKRLSLHTNVLSGTIPTSIGTSSNNITLQYLYLHNNQLSGTIPSTIGNLWQLKEFTIDTNDRMSGTVPNEVCQLRPSLISLVVEKCQTSNVNTSTTSIQGVRCPSTSGGNSNPSTCCTSCRA